jgi:hypothetical protein
MRMAEQVADLPTSAIHYVCLNRLTCSVQSSKLRTLGRMRMKKSVPELLATLAFSQLWGN